MYKGTTPTFTFTLPEDVDLTKASSVYVTFCKSNRTEIFTKTGDEITISEHEVEVFLTQKESLSLPTGQILVQLNWIYEDDGVTKRACSNILSIVISRNLKNEEL